MRKNRRKAVAMALLCVFVLFGCGPAGDTPLAAAGDEIVLRIQLELGEDIGLLVYEYDMGGSTGGGGMSNAGGTLLKRDEALEVTLSRRDMEHPSETQELWLQFSVITQYVPPNMENSYPAELTKSMDPIRMRAEWGQTYGVTIRGDQTHGYQAAWEPEKHGGSEISFRAADLLL